MSEHLRAVHRIDALVFAEVGDNPGGGDQAGEVKLERDGLVEEWWKDGEGT